jgi:hypothetical protein
MLKILSILCYVFAAADFGLFYICDVDLTGVSWSPWVACAIGAVLSWIDNSVNNNQEQQEQQEQ